MDVVPLSDGNGTHSLFGGRRIKKLAFELYSHFLICVDHLISGTRRHTFGVKIETSLLLQAHISFNHGGDSDRR